MGSKKKSGLGKKKKKKTKTTEGSSIAVAIMPSAMLAAVPRTPPPPKPEVIADVDLKGSTGILSASLLGQMFATHQIEEGHATEETDTSLYDYEHARQTMHSTGGSADFSYGIPAPPHGFGDYDSETDVTRTPSPAYMRRSVEAEVEINPIYSTSLKSSQYLSRSPSPSTLRNSGTFTETGTLPRNSTLTETGTLLKYSTLRSSGGSLGTSGAFGGSGGSGGGSRRKPPRRTPSATSVEDRIEAQMVEKQHSQKSSLHSSLEKSLTRVSTDLSHTGSFRLNTLREQNAALVEKQSQLEKQLLSQKQLQEQLMIKLQEQGLLASQNLDQHDGDSTQDVGSLLQETQSVTDQTLEKQEEVMVALKERVTLQERERIELEEMNEQLRMEIISVHRLASARDEESENEGPQKISSLEKQLLSWDNPKPSIEKQLTEIQSAALENQISSPSLENQISRPSVEKHISSPSVEKHVSNLSFEKQISNPSVEKHVSSPSVEKHVSNPSFEKQISNPSFEKQISNPSFGKQISNPPFEKQISSPSFGKQISRPSFEYKISSHSVEKQISRPSFEKHISSHSVEKHISSPPFEEQISSPSFETQISSPSFGKQISSPSFEYKISSLEKRILSLDKKIPVSSGDKIPTSEKQMLTLGSPIPSSREEILSLEDTIPSVDGLSAEKKTPSSTIQKSSMDGDSTVQSSIVNRLKDERDTLQAMTIKLNAELSRYQAKFRPLSQAEMDTLPGLPLTGPKPSWLVNTKYLAPLFVAYDDQLQDREAAVNEMQAELESICHDVEDVVRENQRLHVRLNQSDAGGSVGMTEWQALQEQCKLVLEENQLLMEQLDVQQNKSKDMHKAHIQEVSKLSKRLVVAEVERDQLEQEVVEIRDKMVEIKKEHTRTVIESKSKLDTEVHVSGLSNLKQILEDEKTKHAHELENTMTKLQNLATDRKDLALQVEDLRADNQTMEAEMKVMQKSQKKSQKKIKILQQSLEEASVKEQTAERYLSSIIKVAEKTAKERDTFVEKAETEQRQRKVAVTKVMEGNFVKNKMEEKLKLMKTKASEKLEKAVSRMREQDDDFSQQRQEYEREIKHLRLLLRERQEMIDSAAGEKRRVEDDLETMWQVATADNQRMRDTLHKNLRKLQDHGSLRSHGAVDDANELLLCDSDVEK